MGNDEEQRHRRTLYDEVIYHKQKREPRKWEDPSIRWHEDGMTFDTPYEAWVWAYSEVYNGIGDVYDGYKTTDEKIAYALVYELVRTNTLSGPRFNVYTDLEGMPPTYMVWVTPASDSTPDNDAETPQSQKSR